MLFLLPLQEYLMQFLLRLPVFCTVFILSGREHTQCLYVSTLRTPHTSTLLPPPFSAPTPYIPFRHGSIQAGRSRKTAPENPKTSQSLPPSPPIPQDSRRNDRGCEDGSAHQEQGYLPSYRAQDCPPPSPVQAHQQH